MVNFEHSKYKGESIRRLLPVLAPVLLLVFGAFAVGCGGADADTDDDRVTVVATTTMIEDLARVIGGEEVNVIGIMRTGEDPHLYEVKPKDATTIREADLILLNGLHLEATLKSIIDQHASGKVVALAEHSEIEPMTGGEGFESAPDPHCWMDVGRYKLYVEQARDALIEIAPKHRDLFTERADDYIWELMQLDGWIYEQFNTVPSKQRVIVTGHDAFAYFGWKYGIEVHGLIGISTEQEPTPQDVKNLINLINERGVRAVFPESSISGSLKQLVQTVAKKTGAVVGDELHSDSLGKPGTDAATYIGMMRHNTNTIVKALKGE